MYKSDPLTLFGEVVPETRWAYDDTNCALGEFVAERMTASACEFSASVKLFAEPELWIMLSVCTESIGVEMSVNTSFNVAGPIAQTPRQAIDTLRRSRGLDAVVLVAGDGTVTAAWHGGERDSGRFTGWYSERKAARG